jgi:hypothetical protein
MAYIPYPEGIGVLRHSYKKPDQFVAAFLEITRSKQTEEALRKANALLNSMDFKPVPPTVEMHSDHQE